MKKINAALFAFGAAAFCGMLFFGLSHAAGAAEAPSTCQPSGMFVTVPAGTLTADDQQRSARALEWLKSQEKSASRIEGDGSISMSQSYSKEYTGPITGSFDLGSSQYPVVSDASIEITSPVSMPDSYNGVVQGRVLTTPTAWRWIIQVYKESEGTYTQVPLQALADAETGAFTVDLSSVQNPPSGAWAFGILDAEAAYVPYGEKWPSAKYYDGVEVQQKLVTDGIYDWATTKALADNTYSFQSSNAGEKLVRLVDVSDGRILAEDAPLTGLVRSYEIDADNPLYGSAFANETFVYDQAVAVFAALSVDDEAFAARLVDGMLRMQQTTGALRGGFVFAAPQLSPEYRNVLVRTGAHAIATDALLAFMEHYPDSEKYDLYMSRAEQALGFIDGTLSTAGETEGLYLGGYGDYSGAGGIFAPDTVISWASTEHNIDIWHTFIRAGVIVDESYGNKANELKGHMAASLFNTAQGRYNQGMTVNGPDTANPLDVNSWGAIQLKASGQENRAQTSLLGFDSFRFTRSGITGYAPFYDSPGYPNAVPTVWYEGSYGVLMTYARTGKVAEYRSLLDSLKQGQESDGSFRYATDIDPLYEISDHKSVASTAWFILSTTGLDTMWNRCQDTAPSDQGEVAHPTQPSAPAALEGSDVQSGTSRVVVRSEIATDEEQITSPAPEQNTPEIEKPDAENNATGGIDESNDSEQSTMTWVIWVMGGVLVVSALGTIFAIRLKS